MEIEGRRLIFSREKLLYKRVSFVTQKKEIEGRKKERNYLKKGREEGKFEGKFKKREKIKESGNQSLEKVYLLTQKYLMNCEFEIDD